MRWPGEQETLDELRTRIGSAVSFAAALAILPAKGLTYTKLRADLKQLETLARMTAYDRQDARWLQIGLRMAEVHAVTGHLLRHHYPNPYYREIETWLRGLLQAVDSLQYKKTGRAGMILPKQQHVIRTEGRPVQVLLPRSVAA